MKLRIPTGHDVACDETGAKACREEMTIIFLTLKALEVVT